MDYNNPVKCCHFCEYRYGGCTKTKEEILATYDTHDCDEFVLGRCYFCAIYRSGSQEDWNNICIDTFYPCGCPNFKDGIDDDFLVIEEYNDVIKYHNAYEKQRHHNRRVSTKRYNKKIKRKAEENKYIRGSYFDERKNRVMIGERGRISKWLKNQSNKKLRREVLNEDSCVKKSSIYKKLFDYWWELD